MAGKIRKGFATYLLILFIALVAAFLICVTIMLFSPFKNVLGFQYFFYEEEAYEYNVKGGTEGEIFDMSKINEIKINCDYAKVTVERYEMVDNHAIKIVNKTKGFARDDQNTEFTYELSYENGNTKILNVDVHEPEGFLYFSKNVTISILVPTSSSYALENTKVNITNRSGNIYIGNNMEITTLGNNYVNPNSVSIKTNSGKVVFNPFVDIAFNDIFIKSSKGNIDFANQIVAVNQFEIHSISGNVNMEGLYFQNSTSNAVIDVGNSKFTCKNIEGNVLLSINNGYFNVENIKGNVVSNDSNAQMGGATINIKEITGVISFPFANKSMITIGEIKENSELYVHSTSGQVNIDEAYGKVYVETYNGDVNINTYSNDLQVKTNSGDMNIVYNNTTIANQLDFYTVNGTIDLKIKSSLAFQLAVYDNELTLRKDGVNIDGIKGEFTNPLTVNGGDKKIVIISDGTVNLSLIEVA